MPSKCQSIKAADFIYLSLYYQAVSTCHTVCIFRMSNVT